MDGSENSDEASDKYNVPLTGVEVHNSIVEDGFRNACSSGDMDILKSILSSCTEEEKKELLHKPSVTGTPLFDAIIAGRSAAVSCLVDYGYDLELESDVNIYYPILFRDRCTCLCVACSLGNYDISKLLLEAGADVNHSSQHSSPLIYASEYNDTQLISLLLEYGADVNMVPQSLHTEAAALPLYQACLQGHKDTAEILLHSIEDSLSFEKKVCLLGLLGAQCINKNQDYESGKKYWRMALMELESLKETGLFEGQDIALKLQELYINESNESPSRGMQAQAAFNIAGSSPQQASTISDKPLPLKHRHSVFKDMKLCTSVKELDDISTHQNLLNLQGLLVLESVLGPSHNETTQQVSRAARDALENGNLSFACKLFLYIIECTEKRHQTTIASEYTSQLADLLLNIFTHSPQNLSSMEDFVDILLAAMEFTQEGLQKVYTTYMSGQAAPALAQAAAAMGSAVEDGAEGAEAGAMAGDHIAGGGGVPADWFESQNKQHSKVRILSEMVETFMAYFRMLIDQDVKAEDWGVVYRIVAGIVRVSGQCRDSLFNIESELFKIAIYGGQSASSTLYFFQEDLFPSEKILDCLLTCGADVNRQDISGNTPLHYSIDCPKPNMDIVKKLLDYGSHVDICNRYCLSPYTIMKHKSYAELQPFQYITLKCLSARSIMSFRVPYKGQIPRTLEEFVPLHGIVKFPKSTVQGLKKSASANDVPVYRHFALP